MEEDLKILKVEYLSNHCPYVPQILNLSLGDQTKINIELNISVTTNRIFLEF